MKKEVFIEKAIAVHGDKYDYTLLPDEFVNKDKVPVVCKDHGVFYITTGNHISNKRGCSICGNISRGINNRKSIEEFKEILNFKFPHIQVDFTDYVDYTSNVNVFCAEHGWEFRELRTLLKSTYSCTKCAKINRGLSRRKTLQDFLSKANEVHVNLYDYSSVEFKSFSHPVKILCRSHGIFEQTPTVHIKGHGCKQCADESVGALKRKSLETLPTIYQNDPNVTPHFETYIKSGEVMKFTCKFHGDFYRKPSSKIKGSSLCQKCNMEASGNKRKLTTDEFIRKAKLVFSDYDYSQVDYTGVSRYVTITCNRGHTFSQRAGNLLNGYGCPDCSSTGYSYTKKGYLYLILLDDLYVKFGISNKPEDRLRAIRNGSKFECSVIKTYVFDDGRCAKDLEDMIKSLPIEIGVVSKFYLNTGHTETFKSQDLEFVLHEIDKFVSQLK